MGRKVSFKIEGSLLESEIVKVDRTKLYGSSEKIVYDTKKEECVLSDLYEGSIISGVKSREETRLPRLLLISERPRSGRNRGSCAVLSSPPLLSTRPGELAQPPRNKSEYSVHFHLSTDGALYFVCFSCHSLLRKGPENPRTGFY